MTGTHRQRASTRWRAGGLAVAVGTVITLAMAPSAGGAPLPLLATVVTPGTAAEHGFAETDTRPPGDVEFTTAFGAPAGGNAGALGLSTPDGTSKATYVTAEKNGSLLEFVASASYATYRSSASTGASFQYPRYEIPIDRNGGALEAGDFSTLFYEPVYNVSLSELLTDTWQTWNVAKGRVCSTRAIGGVPDSARNCAQGGLTLGEIAAQNPDATVLGFGVALGAGNSGTRAAVDLLEGAGTTYDFEVTAPPVVVPEVPEVPGVPEIPGPVDPGPAPGPPCVVPDDPPPHREGHGKHPGEKHGQDEKQGKDEKRGEHGSRKKHGTEEKDGQAPSRPHCPGGADR